MSKAKTSLGIWPLYSLVGVFVLLFGSFGLLAYQSNEEVSAAKTTATSSLGILAVDTAVTPTPKPDSQSAEVLYPNTKSMKIRDIEVQASVAQSWPDRIKGLSDTPYLPEHIVKLFVFDSSGLHSFWMKDMNYAIDILWVDTAGVIVHIEEKVSPESYPAMFVPKREAKYVIETAAGFVEKHQIAVGESVVLPTL